MLNPVIAPEYFPLQPKDDYVIIKGLFVSANIQRTPQIVTDSSGLLLSSIFNDDATCVLFPNMIHMYVHPFDQRMECNPNIVATAFTRQHFLLAYGRYPPDVVYGDALFFGTQNLLTGTIDNQDHSIPYRFVEELLRLYDLFQQNS